MPFFKKKSVTIEARLFDGSEQSGAEIRSWAKENELRFQKGHFLDGGFVLLIPTKEGEMTARRGDWIIKGTAGEFYPCKPDIFKDIYEVVE